MNIIIPMAGTPKFYPQDTFKFTRSFVEVAGDPMIQAVINNLSQIPDVQKFIFIVNKTDVEDLNLDNVLKMLTDNRCEIVVQDSETKGAVCSMLLAIEHFNSQEPLLVSNADQVFSQGLSEAVSFFQTQQADAGVVTFDSVHPQWSYVRLGDEGEVVEAAEKRPISRNAIAGLYYFRSGALFVEGAMGAIEKDRSYNGLFYTSLTLNELVLGGQRVLPFQIPNESYHSFYSPNKISEYEKTLKG